MSAWCARCHRWVPVRSGFSIGEEVPTSTWSCEYCDMDLVRIMTDPFLHQERRAELRARLELDPS